MPFLTTTKVKPGGSHKHEHLSLPMNFKEVQNMFKQVQRNSKKFKEVQRSSNKFRRILRISKTFKEDQRLTNFQWHLNVCMSVFLCFVTARQWSCIEPMRQSYEFTSLLCSGQRLTAKLPLSDFSLLTSELVMIATSRPCCLRLIKDLITTCAFFQA